jgi:hypothetical protein
MEIHNQTACSCWGGGVHKAEGQPPLNREKESDILPALTQKNKNHRKYCYQREEAKLEILAAAQKSVEVPEILGHRHHGDQDSRGEDQQPAPQGVSAGDAIGLLPHPAGGAPQSAARSKSIRKKGKEEPKAGIIFNRSRLDTPNASVCPELFSLDGYHVFSLMHFQAACRKLTHLGSLRPEGWFFGNLSSRSGNDLDERTLCLLSD